MIVLSALGFVVNLISVLSLTILLLLIFINNYYKSKAEIAQGRLDIEFIDKQIDIEKRERNNKINKAVVVAKTTSIVLSFFVLIFFSFALINRINDQKIVIGNKTHIVIASGSMSKKHTANEYLINYNLNNQFDEYSIIEVEKINEDDLYTYDVVAFKNQDGVTIIHRIVDIQIEGSQKRYVTRGDANKVSDAYRPTFDDFIGRYNGNEIKHVGVLILFMQSDSGIVTIIALFINLIVFTVLYEKLEKMKRERTDILVSIIDYDLTEETPYFDHDFVQNIYYKDYVYRFKNKEFLGKEKITDPSIFETYDLDNTMTKVTSDDSGVISVETKNTKEIEEKN